MKTDTHPDYHPAIFVDMTTGARFVTRSTKTSEKKETVDGVEYNVISVGVSSDSHPFFTGKQKVATSDGRVARFNNRYKRKSS